MEAIDILKAARARIANPAAWGKGTRNRDRPMETCCAAEAIEEAGDALSPERKRAFAIFYCAAGIEQEWKSMVDWNDAPERTHAEVLKTFDLAIAILR